jgi:hypothetical protein
MELVPVFLDGEEVQALAGIDWYLVCVYKVPSVGESVSALPGIPP